MSQKRDLPLSNLGAMIRLHCRWHEISERDLAAEIGMDHATLHRLVHGEDIRLSNFNPVFAWLLADAKPRV